MYNVFYHSWFRCVHTQGISLRNQIIWKLQNIFHTAIDFVSSNPYIVHLPSHFPIEQLDLLYLDILFLSSAECWLDWILTSHQSALMLCEAKAPQESFVVFPSRLSEE